MTNITIDTTSETIESIYTLIELTRSIIRDDEDVMVNKFDMTCKLSGEQSARLFDAMEYAEVLETALHASRKSND